MARVAIVSHDVQTIFGKAGGAGAFTTRWANLLRQAGESVTIVMARNGKEPMRVDLDWRARYQADGISLIELQAPPASTKRSPDLPAMRLAEIAAPVLRGFELVYFVDRCHAGFHFLRERRYSRDLGPVCITVLYGPSEWELSANGKYPELPGDLHLAFQERYATRHSDFVVSPSSYMCRHLAALGWKFPGEVEVLGLPMPEAAVATEPPAVQQIRRIVYFGRIEERKGLRTFVAAMQQYGRTASFKPQLTLLGTVEDWHLLHSSLADLKVAGFAVSHEGSLNSDGAIQFLAAKAHETLCVIPGSAGNYPYTVIEASRILGLNLIVNGGGGVPEILPGAERQLCGPLARDLADKIAERIKSPLAPNELARYDCANANARWMEFHRKALTWRGRRSSIPAHAGEPSVDVCITGRSNAAHRTQVAEALAQQTDKRFQVFYQDAEESLGAARNGAARRGTADLILFVDSTDVPALNSVERMREAISLSGDDALICASYRFAGQNLPFDCATKEIQAPAYEICFPLGIDLVGGLLNPLVFGESMFAVRRQAFEKLGGFREMDDTGCEHWEFYARLALAGYKIDVLPELLHFYRQGDPARNPPSEFARHRLLEVYERSLASLGLEGGALALAGLYRTGQELEKTVRRLEVQSVAPLGRFAFFAGYQETFERNVSLKERLRLLYRAALPLDARLKFHKIFLAPFIGPYVPPGS